jgi:hypothetical protein
MMRGCGDEGACDWPRKYRHRRRRRRRESVAFEDSGGEKVPGNGIYILPLIPLILLPPLPPLPPLLLLFMYTVHWGMHLHTYRVQPREEGGVGHVREDALAVHARVDRGTRSLQGYFVHSQPPRHRDGLH